MRNIKVICVGKSPLLMNRMPESVLLGLLTGPTGKGSKTREKPATVREAATPKVYALPNGDTYLPIGNLFSCLINAGVHVRLDGKRQVSTADKTTLPGFCSLEGEMDPDAHGGILRLKVPSKTGGILSATPAPWEPDLMQGRNPNGGEAVAICRPRIDAWGFEVMVSVNEEVAPESLVRNLFDIAGSTVGLGDFRPQKKGLYGTFKVALWEVVSDSSTVSKAAE